MASITIVSPPAPTTSEPFSVGATFTALGTFSLTPAVKSPGRNDPPTKSPTTSAPPTSDGVAPTFRITCAVQPSTGPESPEVDGSGELNLGSVVDGTWQCTVSLASAGTYTLKARLYQGTSTTPVSSSTVTVNFPSVPLLAINPPEEVPPPGPGPGPGPVKGSVELPTKDKPVVMAGKGKGKVKRKFTSKGSYVPDPAGNTYIRVRFYRHGKECGRGHTITLIPAQRKWENFVEALAADKGNHFTIVADLYYTRRVATVSTAKFELSDT